LLMAAGGGVLRAVAVGEVTAGLEPGTGHDVPDSVLVLHIACTLHRFHVVLDSIVDQLHNLQQMAYIISMSHVQCTYSFC
jgi:hypothetical protein